MPPMIDATAAIAAMSDSSHAESSARAASTRSVCGRQAAHRELDAPIGQFAPAFDFGHVGGLGEAAKHFARFLSCLLARQREGLAPERIVLGALAQRLGGLCRDIGGGGGAPLLSSGWREDNNKKPKPTKQ